MLCDEGMNVFLDDLEAADNLDVLWSTVVTFFNSRWVDDVAHVVTWEASGRGGDALRILETGKGSAVVTAVGRDAQVGGEALINVLSRRRPTLVSVSGGDHGARDLASGFERTLADRGIRATCVLPLPTWGTVPGDGGLMMLSRRDVDDLKGVVQGDGMCLVLAAAHVHCRVMRLAGQAPGSSPALTGREEEVLTLSARGLTTRQLGDRIGISVSAVNFHLANAGRKLKATNRTHAVSRALALGLIAP